MKKQLLLVIALLGASVVEIKSNIPSKNTIIRTLRLSKMLFNEVNRKKPNIQSIKHLLQEGANPNYINENNYGRTPLMQAAWLGHPTIAQLLLQHGAWITINAQDYTSGATPLYLAVNKRNPDEKLIKTLLHYYASPNIGLFKNSGGFTPLMQVAWLGYLKIAKWLLHYGASPTMKDKWGKTAHDTAKKYKHLQIARMIKNWETRKTARRVGDRVIGGF